VIIFSSKYRNAVSPDIKNRVNKVPHNRCNQNSPLCGNLTPYFEHLMNCFKNHVLMRRE